MSRTARTTLGALLLLVFGVVAAVDLLGGWLHHPAPAQDAAAAEHPWTAASRPPEEPAPSPGPLPPSYYLLFPYVVEPGGPPQE